MKKKYTYPKVFDTLAKEYTDQDMIVAKLKQIADMLVKGDKVSFLINGDRVMFELNEEGTIIYETIRKGAKK